MDIGRREFVKGLAGATLAAATGPLVAEGVAVLRRDETLVAFLSDCHVGSVGEPAYQAVRFAECIAKVLALDPLPAKIIIPGDLAFLWGRKGDYEIARSLLHPVYAAGIEVTVAMGNHDRRENFLEYFPEYAARSPVEGRLVNVVHGAHFDYLLLDSLDEPEATDEWITPGDLDDAQREWLKAACAAAERPFLVVAHHPANELGARDHKGTAAGAREFGELILGSADAPTKCAGFIHGHDHRWYTTRSLRSWQTGIPGLTAALPSTGHWGDIGFALLRETPARAELELVQYDFFTPAPLKEGAEMPPAWTAIVQDHQGARCTFIPART